VQDLVPPACRGEVRFVLSAEISCIYSKGGKVRKVHNVLLLPSLDCAHRLQRRLAAIGNVHSDGRPILGLDSRNLLEIALETDADAVLFPAHIWTPWFSVLGSKSGFDTVEECYADLASHVTVVETGLSSDPGMNRRVSRLDPYGLISSSDAHSADKLGREATLFGCPLTWEAVRNALCSKGLPGLAGTVEFFPEEGKYHLDGHRACEVCLTPAETRAKGGICPVCGKPVTVGVLSRVEELADRAEGARVPLSRPYRSYVPLAEIASQALNVGASSKKVRALCTAVTEQLGSEMAVLGQVAIAEVERCGGERLAEGIRRMRQGKVALDAGYDGVFGTVGVL
jgi:DNA helicase-2/ATP-dependent DNA helicase PcrA